MFRRNKNQGQVAVLDDVPSIPHTTETRELSNTSAQSSSSSGGNNQKSSMTTYAATALGLDSYRTSQQQTREEIGNMTEEEIEKALIESANAGKKSTAQALRIAVEARGIGADTAEKMQQQTAQLDKMTDDIEIVHDYLDKSERTIDKMRTNKFVRMFQPNKSTGKGLDKHKASRKEEVAREELREKGLDAIDIKGMQNHEGVVSMNEIQREQLLNGGTGTGNSNESGNRFRIFGGKKTEGTERVDAQDIREDYSQYSQGVRGVLKKQDEDLDEISNVLGDMKVMANAMNNELAYQGEKIEEVQNFTEETSQRTKKNARNIAKIK